MTEPADEMECRRRRDATATRGAILAAATRRFACQGYEHAGLREIAAEAGVTAALVNRYFGSKEGLFAAVVEQACDIRPLIAGDRATLAERLARAMVYGRDGSPTDSRVPLLLLLRSAQEPCVAELMRTNLDRQNVRLLAEAMGGPDAATRAAMVIALLSGFAILDQMLRPEAFARADREDLVALLTACLSSCIASGP